MLVIHADDVLMEAPFLSADACFALVLRLEQVAFEPTAWRYPAGYRDNDRVVFDDAALAAAWFAQLGAALPGVLWHAGRTWRICGLNTHFRGCRYRDGQSFCVHRDGPWVEGGRRSLLTVMAYLDDASTFTGGDTVFFDALDGPAVRTFPPRLGHALVFAHSRWHEGRPVTAGTKRVLRTDVLYESDAPTEGYLWSLAQTPDGIAAGGRDGAVRLLTDDLRDRARLDGRRGSVLALCHARDSLWGGGRDGALHRWKEGDHHEWNILDGAIVAMCQSGPDLLIAGAQGVFVVPTEAPARGPPLPELSGDGWTWAVAASGPRVASFGADGWLRERGRPPVYVGPGRALDPTRCGWWAGTDDGRLVLIEGGIREEFAVHRGIVRSVKVCDRGVVSGGEDGRVCLTRPEGGSTVLHTHADFVSAVLVRPGAAVSCGYDGEVRRSAMS